GIGTPEQMIEYGRRIMPGVDDYVSHKQDRINQQIEDFNALPGWQDTMAKVDAANDANRRVNADELNLIDQNRNYALNDIADTFHRGVGYEDTAYGANTKDLTERYNTLIDNANSDYGKLRQENKDTYSRLNAQSDDAYKTAFANTELLRPGS